MPLAKAPVLKSGIWLVQAGYRLKLQESADLLDKKPGTLSSAYLIGAGASRLMGAYYVGVAGLSIAWPHGNYVATLSHRK